MIHFNNCDDANEYEDGRIKRTLRNIATFPLPSYRPTNQRSSLDLTDKGRFPMMFSEKGEGSFYLSLTHICYSQLSIYLWLHIALSTLSREHVSFPPACLSVTLRTKPYSKGKQFLSICRTTSGLNVNWHYRQMCANNERGAALGRRINASGRYWSHPDKYERVKENREAVRHRWDRERGKTRKKSILRRPLLQKWTKHVE